MIAVEDLVVLLCLIAQRPPMGFQLWIACGAQSYSTRDLYDLMRKASNRGMGIGWLPHSLWWLGAHALDIVTGQRNGSTYEKLFGTELYSNAAVLAGTEWKPRVTLEHVMGNIIAPRDTDS